MNILITNDDGIESPGVWALAGALKDLADILLVTPDKEQSGVGTSITSVRSHVEMKEVVPRVPGVKAFAIGGTPSDCVILGIKNITKKHIDLLISGINQGPNMGRDIISSGTVMATLGGYFREIPSIAISLALKSKDEPMYFESATRFIVRMVKGIESGVMETKSILNVNIPNLPPEQIKGVKVTRTAEFGYTRLGTHIGSETIAKFQMVFSKPDKAEIEEDTDVWAINQGYISVTPLHVDLTHHEIIPSLQQCFNQIKF